MMFWIYENHICELRSEELNEGWSSQLYTQLLQLRRESQACTGFETLTSALPVQRSTNCANKPTGRRSLNWFVINPWTDDDEVRPTVGQQIMLGVNVGSCCVRVGNRVQTDDCWDLHCIVGRIWPRRLRRPFVIRVRGPSTAGGAVQTDHYILRQSLIKRDVGSCWLKVWQVSNFAQHLRTTRNNMQRSVQTDATCNIQQCWELLANNPASVCTRLNSQYARTRPIVTRGGDSR